MNRIGKIFLSLFVAVFMLAAVGFSIWSFGNTLMVRSGWVTGEDGFRRYLDQRGEPVIGWQVVDGQTYYFDPEHNGAMATDWVKLGDHWYYLQDSGVQTTGWLEQEDGWYYLDQQGRMVKGWLTLEDQKCYFNEEGLLQTGWLELEGERYFLNDHGVLQIGWLETAEGRCYLGENGALAQGWTDVDGKRYFLRENGVVYTGWLEAAEGHYYLGADGAMVQGWLELETGTYYLDSSGTMRRGWLELDDQRYYLQEDGTRATGWLELASGRYYLSNTGVVQTGWLEQPEGLYYLRSDGTMAVGKVMIDGRSCHFTSTGKYTLVVNMDNPIAEDYPLNLVEYQGYQIDAQIRDSFDALLKDCTAAGFTYYLNSVYRSMEDQQQVWDDRLNGYLAEGKIEEEALKLVSESVAVPGYSEHHTGLAADVGGTDEMYQWMADNCWKYGFIVRYPAGTQEYTGVIYEPWHLRYVGKELAQEIYELGVCLEVYFENLTQ